MPYGLTSKEEAEKKMAVCQAAEPECQFKVDIYQHGPGSYPGHAVAVQWGVVRYIPYCEAMPYRCTGFVWF